MYSIGQGVPQNDGTALTWYKLAAERGISLAQNYLGNTYHIGEGVPQNYKIAFSKALKSGVKILCYDCKLSNEEIKLNNQIKLI